MEWTFPASGPLKADLELAAGSVELELSATDEVRVQLETLGRDNDSARDQIANASVACDGSRLDVRVPKRKLREASLRLRVLVPPASSLRVRTASADVSCAGAVATFEAKTSSGDVTVQDGCDAANISTASGDVRLAAVLGEVDVQTASGDVVTGSIGGRASVTTASGDIRLASIAHDGRLRSASGDIAVGCAYEGDLSVNTASGDVRIGVGAGVGAWLDLITVSGDSQCTLTTEGEGEAAAELRISCRTVSGDILVHSGEPATGGRGGDAGTRDANGGGGSGGSSGGGDGPGGLGGDDRFAGPLDAADLPAASAFPRSDPFALPDGFPNAADVSATGSFVSEHAESVPDDLGVSAPAIPGLAKLADLADLAGLGDIADLMMRRSTRAGETRLPWWKP